MIETDINKPLNIQDFQRLRTTTKATALKNIYKSLPVVLIYILFLMFGGKTGQLIDNWVQSLFSLKVMSDGVTFSLAIGFSLVTLRSIIIIGRAIIVLDEMNLSSEELKSLQKQVYESGDKVCAKYLVEVNDMDRPLLSCEKKMILQRITELKKDNEINQLRNML